MATSPSRQFHDLVSGDAAGAAPAHVFDERLSAVRRSWRSRLLHADGTAIDLELDLGVREKAQGFPDVDRDGDLSFARDPHEYYSYQ
jgi:hypothetical protein